jgi:hypothetical protein
MAMEITDGSYRMEDVLVRWREHAREWARRHLPHMAETRIDPDYNAEEDRDRETMRILRQLITRPSGYSYHEGGGNGEKRTLNWILGVLSLLLVGAIGGGISMYGKFSSLETKVVEWQRASDRRMDAQDQRIDRLENRR